MNRSRIGIAVGVVGTLLAGPVSAQVTQRVSLSSAGVQADLHSNSPVISADGRFVAFTSTASNLVPGDVSGYFDVFVRDRLNGTTERASVGGGGNEPDDQCSHFKTSIAISGDGRYVAFSSVATNLVPGDTRTRDVYVRDLQLDTNERVSVDSGGIGGDGESLAPALSGDGRYVAFESWAMNLVPGDNNLTVDVFVRDRQLGTIERADVDSSENESIVGGTAPAISADGSYVAFVSNSNLVAGDTNDVADVFVRNRVLGTTERVSVSSGGAQGDDASGTAVGPPSACPIGISGDGRYVVFASRATNLVAGDTNAQEDIFVRDRFGGTTVRASVHSSGVEANGISGEPAISASGRYVSFWSDAANLAAEDDNGITDVFVRDLVAGTTALVSKSSGGARGNGPSQFSSISATGQFIAFGSDAENLDQADTNIVTDIFVRDRIGGTSFASLCNPGLGGVQSCPCANPPSGAGRGCNNSSSTGGAVLAGAGGSYLSSDSAVFTTSGERPTATSILLQGTSSPAAGILYGQGVRCMAGTLTRLFTKSAVAGSITAPDFGAGDPTVSARSAAKGDTIAAGQSRWYLVFYRDPTVLGGCPAASTFNATQTGRLVWSP